MQLSSEVFAARRRHFRVPVLPLLSLYIVEAEQWRVLVQSRRRGRELDPGSAGLESRTLG